MHLLSAYEDFVNGTLRSIPRQFDRLRYFQRLRNGTGGYVHWGLESVYGKDAVQQALRRAHHEVIAELLRTPLRTLHENAAGNHEESVGGALHACRKLLPLDASRAQELHFNSVLLAVSHLSGRPATHRAA